MLMTKEYIQIINKDLWQVESKEIVKSVNVIVNDVEKAMNKTEQMIMFLKVIRCTVFLSYYLEFLFLFDCMFNVIPHLQCSLLYTDS